MTTFHRSMAHRTRASVPHYGTGITGPTVTWLATNGSGKTRTFPSVDAAGRWLVTQGGGTIQGHRA